MEWRSQVAVVTGGARGLGRATARLLAQRWRRGVRELCRACRCGRSGGCRDCDRGRTGYRDGGRRADAAPVEAIVARALGSSKETSIPT